MIRQRAIAWAASTAVVLGAAGFSLSVVRADGPTTEPAAAIADAPATQPVAEATAKVTPEARKLLDQLKDAYGSLKTLDVTGSINANFDIDGEQNKEQTDFVGAFQSGGKFRAEIKDDSVIGFTGEKQFVYLPGKNSYLQFDAPKGKVDLTSINGDIADVVRRQDMSLALALAPDAANELIADALTVSRLDDVKIDDVAFPTLSIAQKDLDVTVQVDPTTHLLRRANMDLSKRMTERGAQTIKAATVAFDFKNVANSGANQQFAWAPPAGAEEMHQPAAENSSLKGAAAPAFALDGLDGTKVASADLKGSVYVLDFWATWCGPCVASLPELNKIYEDNKAAGLKVFAVNLEEDKDKVKKFVDEKKITIPVLLDTEGKTGEAYGANAIPETVVIGKDGKVLEVFVGSGHETEIRTLVESTLKAK